MRKTARIGVIFLLSVAILCTAGSSSEARRRKRRSTASSAGSCRAVILSDSTKAQRLYGKNVNMRVLPASTTKVMTILLALERLSLDQYVRVSNRATYVQPSMIYAKEGEEYRVRDLLYAMVMKSANDASIVIAEAVAGSEPAFVELMNRRARQLGAKNTKFANANGLPTKASQYTTAYDMYLIFRQALKHAFFREAIHLRNKKISSKSGRQIALRSYNKMLFMGWKQDIVGKTGYTRAAQACFIGTVKKGKSDLIIGVFGCSGRWNVIKRVVSRYGGISL